VVAGLVGRATRCQAVSEGGSERLRGNGGEQSGGGIWIFFEDGDLE
jgi:hypothetical protein